MRVAYADPPYPGMSGFYADHPDYAGEIDHALLLKQLDTEYDGWLLHTASTTLREVFRCADRAEIDSFRVMAWCKSFAAFKKNVCPAYAWEPVLVKPCRKPTVDHRIVMRDWIVEGITLQRGLVGAKPEDVCRWGFEMLGLGPDDELIDLFPGTGAVTRAWERWRNELRLPLEAGPDAFVSDAV